MESNKVERWEKHGGGRTLKIIVIQMIARIHFLIGTSIIPGPLLAGETRKHFK